MGMSKLRDLSWEKDKILQEEAIKYFTNNESFDFNILIKDSPKDLMENLVEIIINKEVTEQYKATDGLLFLLQDLS